MEFPIAIRAVAFDLDGTLLDTVPDLTLAGNLMLAELGRPAVSEDAVRHYIGNGIQRIVKRILTGDMEAEPDAALFRDALARYEHHYLAHVHDRSTLYPGVVEGLAAMREMGLKLAVVTNKTERFTLPLLQSSGLLPWFELVVSGDTLPNKKPDPDQLYHAAGKLGVTPAQMLMIGDSGNDMAAARAAGCPVFCVPYGYRHGHAVSDLDKDALIEDFRAALPLIRVAA